jgi:hypothetical protein
MEPDVNYHIYKRPPCVPFPRKYNPVHVYPFEFLKIYFNIILPTTYISTLILN